jgi:Ca2+-binding EF-hand superfamily protein
LEQMAKELLAAQEEVQRRFARAMRTRKQSVLKHAHESLLSDRRSSAAALRAEMDRHSGRDVTRRLSGVEPAPEKEVVALSKRFNKSLAHLFPESRSHMWFKLFQKMDPDESGQISFVEFQRGIREVLKDDQVPENRLEALWRALDEDSSGFMIAGEFGRFMKLGWEEMLEEQQRVKSMLTRPVWTNQFAEETEQPNFKELQEARLKIMHEKLRENIARLEAESARMEAEAARAEQKLKQLGKSSPRGGVGKRPPEPASRTKSLV